MDMKPARCSYITGANLGKDDVHLPKHQAFGETKNAPQEIVHTKDER